MARLELINSRLVAQRDHFYHGIFNNNKIYVGSFRYKMKMNAIKIAEVIEVF